MKTLAIVAFCVFGTASASVFAASAPAPDMNEWPVAWYAKQTAAPLYETRSTRLQRNDPEWPQSWQDKKTAY